LIENCRASRPRAATLTLSYTHNWQIELGGMNGGVDDGDSTPATC